MAAAVKSLKFADVKSLLAEAWKEFNDDNAPRLGAALAYYTVLSIAPLLVIVIAIAGLAFGKEAAEGQIFAQVKGLMGDQGASMIQEMIRNASNMGSGIIATSMGVALLLFGASSVVAELRNALNVVWDVPKKDDGGVKDIVKERSYALAVVLGAGFLLLVSLVLSAGIAAAEHFVGNMLPIPEAVLQAINFVVSLVVITGVFALLFKFLPDIDLRWKDVLLGAAFTAVLFTIGKFALGMYIGNASFGSTYGAAGSLVIVLVWVYYSSQILFFGAEFTQVYARDFGSDPRRIRQQQGAKGQQPPAVAAPAEAREYASSAASGNATLGARNESTGQRATGMLVSAGMIAGVFAAAANELRKAFGKRS